MKQETTRDKPVPADAGAKTIRHEQEDAASRDYKHQREGGYKKKTDDKPKQTPP